MSGSPRPRECRERGGGAGGEGRPGPPHRRLVPSVSGGVGGLPIVPMHHRGRPAARQDASDSHNHTPDSQAHTAAAVFRLQAAQLTPRFPFGRCFQRTRGLNAPSCGTPPPLFRVGASASLERG